MKNDYTIDIFLSLSNRIYDLLYTLHNFPLACRIFFVYLAGAQKIRLTIQFR